MNHVPLAVIGLSLFASAQGAVIYSEDFSTSTLTTSNFPPYLGGFFAPQAAFQTWYGGSALSITTGELVSSATGGAGTAGIFLPPSLFPEAGLYRLTFDVTGYTNSSAIEYGIASVWGGDGYDLTLTTDNALMLNTESVSLVPQGSATSSQLAEMTFNTPGNDRTLDFTYSGSGTVALFFGERGAVFPFPVIKFDNIEVAAIPEPASSGLIILGATVLWSARRRR